MSGGADIALLEGGRDASPLATLEIAYHSSHAGLVHFLSGRLHCRHTAEDVAQDLFLALPKATEGGHPVRNPKAFLYSIARRMAINRSVQDCRRAELRAESADILWTAVDEVTPERALLGSEALELVRGAIETMPERTRQILAWRRVDGLTNREIAGRLGISTTAVENHMRGAMERLVAVLHADDA